MSTPPKDPYETPPKPELAPVLMHKNRHPVVTPSAGFIGGIKIHNTGLMEDPVPGSKRGKGVQHLNSDFWIEDMGVFIHDELSTLQAILRAYAGASNEQTYNGLLNKSNIMFMKALKAGLKGPVAEKQWLMASWLTMAAAEIDDYNYSKYTPEQRQQKIRKFFDIYLEDPISRCREEPAVTPTEGIFAVRAARIDLLPPVALERLAIHNELCQLKYGDTANGWMLTGFKLSKRVDSLKRHIDEAHYKDQHEDAIAHLIWNFMAIHHVNKVFPGMNDLPDYAAIAKAHAPAD